MAPPSKTLEEVARYARKIGAPAAADRLEWLNNLVTQGTPAQRSALASDDLHQLLDVNGLVESLKVGQATPTWLGILEWIRNILVLVPLVLTWYAISQAVSAYQNLLDSRTGDYTNTPFIYLWQQGFNGYLTSGPRLSTLAALDAILLCVLVLFTLLVSGRAHVYNNHKERSAEKLRTDLAEALAQIKLALATNPYNTQQPTNFVTHFDQVSRQLLGAIQQERDVLNQLVLQGQQSQQQQTQMMTEMQNMMQAFQQTGQTFTQAAQTLLQANQGLEQTAQALQQSAQQVSSSVTSLGQMVTDLTAEQGRLVAAGNSVASGLQTIQARQETLINTQSQMVAEQTKILPGLESLRQAAQQSIITIEQDMLKLGQRADDVVVTLGVAGKEVENLVQRIDTLSTRQEGYVDALKQMQQDQQLMVTNFAALAGSMANAINQLPSLQITMQGVWAEANNTVRLMGTLPARVQANIDSLLNAHQLAAGELVQGSRTLKDASNDFRVGVDQMRRYFP